MKSIWKGSISFGLVNIPVELYTARESQALAFTLLHETCHTPLKYHRWCPKCKKDVQWESTVKGIKKTDNRYLILTQETLHALRPEKTDTISIVEFVSTDQIPIIYIDQHYYIAPQKKADSAYSLFIKALEKLKKAAIGTFVMRDKEYICVIQPNDGYLLLTTLHYAYEVRNAEKLLINTKAAPRPAELKLAEEFIKRLSVKKFDISRFKDTFAQEIKKLLKTKTTRKKVDAKPITPKLKTKPSLTESLRSSINLIRSRPVAQAKQAKGKR